MGSKQTKEEVIIAQTASGDAQATTKHTEGINHTDIMLIVLIVGASLAAVLYMMRKCKANIVKTLRREITRGNITVSTQELTSSSV